MARVVCVLISCAGWLEAGAIASEMQAVLVAQGPSIEAEQRRQLNEDMQLRLNRRPPPPGIDGLPTQNPSEAVPAGPCEAYEGLNIANPMRLSRQVLQRVEERLDKTCLNDRDVEEIIALLNEHYIGLGLITTRAVRLQSQDRKLNLLVVAGFIEEIRKANTDDTSLDMVFPGHEGRLLDMWELEEGLEKINALGSNNARVSIQPGTKLGGSIVVYQNVLSRQQRFNLGVDNLGGKNTGVWQWTLGGSFDNVLGIQDSLYVSVKGSQRTTVRDAYSASYSLQYQFPYGLNQYSLSWQGGQYEYPVPLASGLVPRYTGRWDTLALGWERLLMRNSQSRTAFEARLKTSKSRNRFADQILELQSPRLSSLELELKTRVHLPAGGTLQGSLTWLKGIGAFGGVWDISRIDPQYPSSRFSAYRLTAGLDSSFGPVNLSSQLEIQSSGDALYSASQFAIGSPSSVRGFSKHSATGSSGVLFRNTLSWPVVVGWPVGQFLWTPYLGWDIGHVSARNSLSGHPVNLEGVSYGMKFAGRSFSLDVVYSRPVRRNAIPQEKGQVFVRGSMPF